MTFKCILVVIAFGYSLPYNLPRDRLIEYFNEAAILLCVYHEFLFTDFLDNADTRYLIGYSLIVLTCLNILGNFGLLMYVTC
jgi:hypothetical protein